MIQLDLSNERNREYFPFRGSLFVDGEGEFVFTVDQYTQIHKYGHDIGSEEFIVIPQDAEYLRLSNKEQPKSIDIYKLI